MAANFWTSNQRAGLLSDELYKAPPALLRAGMSARDVQRMKEFFCTRIFTMVASLDKARLRVATTACIFFYRFFHKYTFQQHDPRLIVPACIYLAVKVNENNIQKSKFYTAFAISHDPSLVDVAFTTKMLLDYEVLLLQTLDCNLLVFSAHSDLLAALRHLKAHPAMHKPVFQDHVDAHGHPLLAQHAWSAVCDAYCCGAANAEPPITVALTAAFLAATYLQIDTTEWLAGVDHDADGIMRVATRIASMHSQPQLSNSQVLTLLHRLGVPVKVEMIENENEKKRKAGE